ncbi:uncharacterized protein LOC143294672 [Babylonia areolata]|uniref:uncharacterized protein LOC143294672 n=1 Tax=Babylonia areolata TaxID=304850 RepID=UPI003FD14375
MAGTGLTVKERLALLNSNSNTTPANNNNNNNNKPAGSPVKPALNVTPKPKPGEAAKPGVVAGFKPVTPGKPVTTGAPTKPEVVPGSKADTPKTPDHSRPALATKPAAGPKPFTSTSTTSTTPTKPGVGAEDASKANGPGAPLFPKLRPVGGTPTPSSSSPSQEAGGEGGKAAGPVTQAVVNGTSGGSSGGSSSQSPDLTPGEKRGSIITPLKPVSVQERLAALRQKSYDAENAELYRPKHHDSLSPTPKSTTTTTTKTSPTFPSSHTASVNEAHHQDSAAEPKPGGLPGIKRSDIAKSLTHAADRRLRGQTATTTTPTSSSASAAGTDASEKQQSKRSSHVYQRRDGKKFRKVDLAKVTPSSPAAPPKPKRLDTVDLKPFLKAYATAKEEKLKADGEGGSSGGGEGDMEEQYVEAESTTVAVRGRKGSTKRATSARVSVMEIPEYTEEEEEAELYMDGSSGGPPPPEPEETYDDCESGIAQPEKQEAPLEDPDEIYEPLDDQPLEDFETVEAEPPPPPLPSPNTPERARERDKENKEKEEAARRRDKAREEAIKTKEEKERKKKEEELKKMRRKFGLTDTDEKVGDGVVKNNAGGGGLFSKDLAVLKGESIAILRMDGNPAGKWLVQNEQGKIGFVSSNNIEISTPTIKNLMAGIKHETPPSEPEDTYEDLPEGDMDEIYEEV